MLQETAPTNAVDPPSILSVAAQTQRAWSWSDLCRALSPPPARRQIPNACAILSDLDRSTCKNTEQEKRVYDATNPRVLQEKMRFYPQARALGKIS